MKDLDPVKDPQDNIRIEQVQKEQEKTYQGTVKLQKGQRVWSINMVENFSTVKPVDVTPEKSKTATLPGMKKANLSLIIEKNHFYCVALNERNAIKKYIQYLIENKKIRELKNHG